MKYRRNTIHYLFCPLLLNNCCVSLRRHYIMCTTKSWCLVRRQFLRSDSIIIFFDGLPCENSFCCIFSFCHAQLNSLCESSMWDKRKGHDQLNTDVVFFAHFHAGFLFSLDSSEHHSLCLLMEVWFVFIVLLL